MSAETRTIWIERQGGNIQYGVKNDTVLRPEPFEEMFQGESEFVTEFYNLFGKTSIQRLAQDTNQI